MHIARDEANWSDNQMLRTVKRRMLAAAPRLDLWPVFRKTIFAGGAKSYHFGGTFPHGSTGGTPLCSDRVGRTGGFETIHLIDASVFPSVPATTFTFTIMANAHRIACEAAGLDPTPALATGSLSVP
jgi:choline dehydrogenase-like flavoprotein